MDESQHSKMGAKESEVQCYPQIYSEFSHFRIQKQQEYQPMNGFILQQRTTHKNSCIHGGPSGEMAQWLRALTVLPEALSSIPSNHMVVHNHL